MKGALDHLHSRTNKRFIRLHDADVKFGFLLDVEGLCFDTSYSDLKKTCTMFGKTYGYEFYDTQLYEEILDFRMLLSSSGCGRSFCKLKLIHLFLTASMGQDRLCHLALLSIEREEIEKTDFEYIKTQFLSLEARKVQF